MGKEEGKKEKGEAYPYQHFLKFGSIPPCQFYWGVMVDDVWDNKQLAELSTLLMNLATYLKIKIRQGLSIQYTFFGRSTAESIGVSLLYTMTSFFGLNTWQMFHPLLLVSLKAL